MSGDAKSVLTERQGIDAVNTVVHSTFAWISREQPIVDQGIDLHIEVAQGGLGSGRLLAAQVKTGKSYFRRLASGFGFYFNERQRDLWIGHALPVIVVFVDPEDQTILWEKIDETTVRQTPTGYAVTLGLDRDFRQAKAELEVLASALVARASASFNANLEVLPPSTSKAIMEVLSSARFNAELLALHLAEGRNNPGGTARSLLGSRPHWMASSTGWQWEALASYCASHEALEESSLAFELAAEVAEERRSLRLSIAALNIALTDRTDRARGLLTQIPSGTEEPPPAVVARLLLDHGGAAIDPEAIDAAMNHLRLPSEGSATVESFLARNYLLRGELDRATQHARRAQEIAPGETSHAVRLAEALLARSESSQAQPTDASEAVALLADAVRKRRTWSGPTRALLTSLSRALFTSGDSFQVIEWLAEPPRGTASSAEATDPVLTRLAFLAALQSDEAELAREFAERMAPGPAKILAKARLSDNDLDPATLIELLEQERESALASGDVHAALDAMYQLARQGIPSETELERLVSLGSVSRAFQSFLRGVAKIPRDEVAGLIDVRQAAETLPLAADFLIEHFRANEDIREAIDIARNSYARFRRSTFLTDEALMRAQFEVGPEVEGVLETAIGSELAPERRLQLRLHLARIYALRPDHVAAERVLQSAMRDSRRGDVRAVWGLIEVLIRGSEYGRAAAVILERRPQVDDEFHARLWAAAMTHVPWDEGLASEALTLATRFGDSPDLAVGLLTHLVSTTQGTPEASDQVAIDRATPNSGSNRNTNGAEPGVDGAVTDTRPAVPGELHRQAFEEIRRLAEQHGPESGVRLISTENLGELIGQLSELVRGQSPEQLVEMLEDISRGRLPVGVLAPMFGRTYSELLVRRGAGLHVAVAGDDEEHAREVSVARGALRATVAIDLSAVLILSCLSSQSDLIGAVGALVMPRAAREDIARHAVAAMGASASRGWLSWNAHAERPELREQSSTEYEEYQGRKAAFESAGLRVNTREDPSETLFPDVPEFLEGSSWLRTIGLAHSGGFAFWCDDLATRRLARAVGVESFSTAALADVLRDDRLDEATNASDIERVCAWAEDVYTELIGEWAVDVPTTTEQIARMAAATDYAPAAAALPLTRPAWWRTATEPMAFAVVMIRAARGKSLSNAAGWVAAAMLGIARAANTDEAGRRLLAGLAILASLQPGQLKIEPAELATNMRLARDAALRSGRVGDPATALPSASEFARTAGADFSDDIISEVLRLLDEQQGAAV